MEALVSRFVDFGFPFPGVTYDFTHSASDESLSEVGANNELIEAVHLSDALRDRPLDPNERHQHLPLGYGDYPVVEFVDFLERIGYERFVVLEYHPEYDALLRGDAAALRARASGDRGPLDELVERRRADGTRGRNPGEN